MAAERGLVSLSTHGTHRKRERERDTEEERERERKRERERRERDQYHPCRQLATSGALPSTPLPRLWKMGAYRSWEARYAGFGQCDSRFLAKLLSFHTHPPGNI